MALASAGCEMSSSSYTAGPRPELPGLWAAELASVASTQALQRAWQAGLRGRRQRKERLGTSQEQAGQVRRWLRSGEARAARMAGRAGSAYGEPPMSRCGPSRSRFPRSFRPSIQSKEAPDRPCSAFTKLEPTFFVRDSVDFARYSDFRYLVVWVCIPGLVNGTASATRAPCGQSPMSCAVKKQQN